MDVIRVHTPSYSADYIHFYGVGCGQIERKSKQEGRKEYREGWRKEKKEEGKERERKLFISNSSMM